jgi:hypothetical protein
MRTQPFFLKNVNDDHLRYISSREGNDLVEGGTAMRVYRVRQHGKPRELAGYKLKVACNPPNAGEPTIKVSEVHTNAGLNGESRTARLPEFKRKGNINRRSLLVEEEDFIERAKGKVALWPLAADTKAPRVGPAADVFSKLLAAELDFLRRVYPN